MCIHAGILLENCKTLYHGYLLFSTKNSEALDASGRNQSTVHGLTAWQMTHL